MYRIFLSATYIIKKGIKISFVIIILISCQMHNEDANSRSNLEKPKRYIGDSSIFPFIERNREFLVLDRLDSGYYATQLRFWYGYDDPRVSHIIVLKKNEDWIAEVHTIYFKDTMGVVRPGQQVIDTVSPKSGWKTFIDSLTQLEVFSLPDQTKLKNMPITYNQPTISVETIKDSAYRFYNYSKPIKYIVSFKEAQKIEMIMSLIENELRVKRLEFF